jgi:hypothetical protein
MRPDRNEWHTLLLIFCTLLLIIKTIWDFKHQRDIDAAIDATQAAEILIGEQDGRQA